MKSPELFTFLFGLIFGICLLGIKYDLQEEWKKDKENCQMKQDSKEILCRQKISSQK